LIEDDSKIFLKKKIKEEDVMDGRFKKYFQL